MDFLLVINFLSRLGNEAEIDLLQTKVQHHSIQNSIFHDAPHNKKQDSRGKKSVFDSRRWMPVLKRSAGGQPANDSLRFEH